MSKKLNDVNQSLMTKNLHKRPQLLSNDKNANGYHSASNSIVLCLKQVNSIILVLMTKKAEQP